MQQFIGRESWLKEFQQKREAKKGEIWKIEGHSGLGKSTLLRQGFAEQCIASEHIYTLLDMEDLSLSSGLEVLSELVNNATFLDVENANKTLKEKTGEWFGAIGKTVSSATDLSKDLYPGGSAVAALTKLGINALSSTADSAANMSERAAQEHPERYLLEILGAIGESRPVLLVDSYEHLLATESDISSSIVFENHRILERTEKDYALQIWLNDLFSYLQNTGWLVVIAGQKIPSISTGLENKSQQLERFSIKEIIDAVSQHPYLDSVFIDHKGTLPHVLSTLSFGGNPLWLRLGMNLLEDLLRDGEDLNRLKDDTEYLQQCFYKGHSPNIDAFSAFLDDDSHLSGHIEHAKSKLKLIDGFAKPIGGLDENIWKIALPRQLDEGIINVLFPEDDGLSIAKRFQKAGVFRQPDRANPQPRLHEEIRDLLLAYAENNNWLDTKETRLIHNSLWEHINQQNIQKLTEPFQQQLTREGLNKLAATKKKKPFDALIEALSSSGSLQWMAEASYHRALSWQGTEDKKITGNDFWLAVGSSASLNPVEKWRVVEQLVDNLSTYQIKGLLKVFNEEFDRWKNMFSKDIAVALQKEEALGNTGVIWNEYFWSNRIEKFGQSGDYLGLAEALGQNKKLKRSIAAYDDLITRFSESDLQNTQKHCAQALVYKGFRLGQLDKPEAAINTYDALIEYYGESKSPSIRNICLNANANTIEPLICFGNSHQATLRIKHVIEMSTPDSQYQAIMPFLHWIAEPSLDPKLALTAILNFDEKVVFEWSWDDIKPALLELSPSEQVIAECYINFFSHHNDCQRLTTELEELVPT